MKSCLTFLVLLIALRASAQLTVGSEGMTILATTSVTVDGLTLTPSTDLALANNSIQRSSTPITGNPSINRLYQFGSPIIFSGTAGIYYLPAELNNYPESKLQLAYTSAANTSLTVTSGSTVNTTSHYVTKSLTNQNLFFVTASALPDLTPVFFARPFLLRGTSTFTVVVDVFEINSVPTNRPITVYVTKDPSINLTFNGALTQLNNKAVQNSVWTFNGTSNSSFYVLTTNQVINGATKLSFGLNGVLTPGESAGTLSITSIVVGSSAVEARINNNSDADKIEYFAR